MAKVAREPNEYGVKESYSCVTWLILICDMTHSYVSYPSSVREPKEYRVQEPYKTYKSPTKRPTKLWALAQTQEKKGGGGGEWGGSCLRQCAIKFRICVAAYICKHKDAEINERECIGERRWCV